MTRNFATIGAVYEDGVTLIFDGEEEASEKHYLCNTSAEFHDGDRVRIVECDGTYIVEYVVGAPNSGGGGGGLPPGGLVGQVLKKHSVNDGDVEWGAVPTNAGGVPSGGSINDVLVKTGAGNYAAGWEKSAPLADAVKDQYNSGTYTTYGIQFRYYQSKFWARYNQGNWVALG